MSDQLLVVLRVCLLVLMYLVFLRVLRAVWVEMRGSARVRSRAVSPASEPARAPEPSPVAVGPGAASFTRALVAVEPAHLAGTAFALDQETTIGRAAGCRIAVDDTHVSKVHARVFLEQGRWFIEDLGSTNGTAVNDGLVSGATALEPGDRVRVGETILELQ